MLTEIEKQRKAIKNKIRKVMNKTTNSTRFQI